MKLREFLNCVFIEYKIDDGSGFDGFNYDTLNESKIMKIISDLDEFKNLTDITPINKYYITNKNGGINKIQEFIYDDTIKLSGKSYLKSIRLMPIDVNNPELERRILIAGIFEKIEFINKTLIIDFNELDIENDNYYKIHLFKFNKECGGAKILTYLIPIEFKELIIKEFGESNYIRIDDVLLFETFLKDNNINELNVN